VQTKEIEKEKKKGEGKESKKCMGHNGGNKLTLKVGRKKENFNGDAESSKGRT
jgi:hypothetical protein